jgi:hypothetical protein
MSGNPAGVFLNATVLPTLLSLPFHKDILLTVKRKRILVLLKMIERDKVKSL